MGLFLGSGKFRRRYLSAFSPVCTPVGPSPRRGEEGVERRATGLFFVARLSEKSDTPSFFPERKEKVRR
jgi:hypothetical protein